MPIRTTTEPKTERTSDKQDLTTKHFFFNSTNKGQAAKNSQDQKYSPENFFDEG